jgi:uncharacterized SAM-binding protein YcdF (DUF218 family)
LWFNRFFLSAAHANIGTLSLRAQRIIQIGSVLRSHVDALADQALFRTLKWLLAALIVIVSFLLLMGDNLLIASDPVPAHVDAAIVLQGSIVAEGVRIAGAIDLLQRGVADRVLLSVPQESYWGQSIPPIARTYLQRTYGSDLAARVDFCKTKGDVDSTLQEAQALGSCIGEQHWHSIVIVTSNYHTRRAGMLWRRITRHDPNIHIWIDGVTDPEFPQPWWRHRQSAKIWVMEATKLIWVTLGGR